MTKNIVATEAQPGDYFHGSPVESVSKSSKHIAIRYVGGGSHTMSLAQARLTTVQRYEINVEGMEY